MAKQNVKSNKKLHSHQTTSIFFVKLMGAYRFPNSLSITLLQFATEKLFKELGQP